ncbi:hypothetical protein BC629DRAFT_1441918 [Irpex lacteus]|nr:hypothetical protein BC629DRAFT_1441918 [Irpex lacteus]
MFLRSGKVVVIVIRDSKSLLVRVRNRDSTIEFPSSVGRIISLCRDEGGEWIRTHSQLEASSSVLRFTIHSHWYWLTTLALTDPALPEVSTRQVTAFEWCQDALPHARCISWWASQVKKVPPNRFHYFVFKPQTRIMIIDSYRVKARIRSRGPAIKVIKVLLTVCGPRVRLIVSSC